jgi:hypothetical protein
MLLQTAATCSSAPALGRGRRSGLRLCGLAGFQVFWASGACAACAGSSVFRSAAFLGCAVSHVAGANPAVKQTRQRRAAYFVR